jgi:hypothetical protein
MAIDHRFINPQKRLNYSQNWNNKLNSKFHTTIRLREEKYQVSDFVLVWLKEQCLFKGLIHEVRHFTIDQVPVISACCDTGLSPHEAIAAIKAIYPDADWSTQQLSIFLIENIEQ